MRMFLLQNKSSMFYKGKRLVQIQYQIVKLTTVISNINDDVDEFDAHFDYI